MGGRDSLSKRKLSKRKREKTSSQKCRRKESKKRSRIHDSLSSYSEDELSNSEHTSSFPSKSDHKRKINKYEKLRRDYSTSSSSDDQSLSSDSDSSSDDYKRKKGRRSRLDLKSNKKRARQRSARTKGDGDAHSGKKRKRSGRDGVAKPKKKSSKKKTKKYSSSYSSSDSESCSTCQSNSSNNTADDSKHKRSKIILDSERERLRGRESHKAHKKHKIRSPSCSSCDRGSKHSVGDGALLPVNNNNNSRRLRSVIVVSDQRYDEGEINRCEKDPQKEEIVYDQNDYPSPKSQDSNEGGIKMELDNQSHGTSSKIIGVENIAGEEVTERGKSRINEGGHQSKAVGMSNLEKGKEIVNSVPVADLGGDVLESILRQKALENLKKFNGRLQTGSTTTTNLEMNNESNVNRSFDAMVENVQNKSTKHEGNSNTREMNKNSGLSQKNEFSELKEVKKLSDSENVEKMNRNSGLSQKMDISQLTEVKKLSDSENVEKMDRNSGLSQKRDLSQHKEVKKLSDSEDVEKMNRNSGLSQKSDLSKFTEVKKLSVSENVEKMDRNSGLSQKKDLSRLKEVKILSDSENVGKMNRNSGLSQKRNRSEFKKLSGSENVEKESGMCTPTVEHPTDGDSLLECSKEGKYVISNAVLNESVSRIETRPGAKTMNAGSSSITEPYSSIGPMSGEHSLERGNEGKDGSQYEQKTMSVMRGGEMVQVSYKVYIPKKAPVLARRPLRR